MKIEVLRHGIRINPGEMLQCPTCGQRGTREAKEFKVEIDDDGQHTACLRASCLICGAIWKLTETEVKK